MKARKIRRHNIDRMKFRVSVKRNLRMNNPRFIPRGGRCL